MRMCICAYIYTYITIPYIHVCMYISPSTYTHIDSHTTQHTKTQELIMTNNQLVSMPAVIHEIGCGRATRDGKPGVPSLTSLDLSFNSIVALPSGLAAMTLLKVLKLCHNQVCVC